jgi:hypothetical protein
MNRASAQIIARAIPTIDNDVMAILVVVMTTSAVTLSGIKQMLTQLRLGIFSTESLILAQDERWRRA